MSPSPRRRLRKQLPPSAVGWCFWPIIAAGCQSPSATIQIIDFRGGTQGSRYDQEMGEAYFRSDASGKIDVVLVEQGPSVSGGSRGSGATQMVHVSTVWKPVPGKTVAETAQLNGTVRLALRSGVEVFTYEGAGAVFLKNDRWTGALCGTIEEAVLNDCNTRRTEGPILERPSLSGRFCAERNPRRVNRVIQEIDLACRSHE